MTQEEKEQLYEAKGLVYHKKYKEALIIFQQLYTSNPSNERVIFEYAHCLSRSNKQENIELARNLFKGLQLSIQYYENATFELGKLEANARNIELARACFKELFSTSDIDGGLVGGASYNTFCFSRFSLF